MGQFRSSSKKRVAVISGENFLHQWCSLVRTATVPGKTLHSPKYISDTLKLKYNVLSRAWK